MNLRSLIAGIGTFAAIGCTTTHKQKLYEQTSLSLRNGRVPAGLNYTFACGSYKSKLAFTIEYGRAEDNKTRAIARVGELETSLQNLSVGYDRPGGEPGTRTWVNDEGSYLEIKVMSAAVTSIAYQYFATFFDAKLNQITTALVSCTEKKSD